MKMLVAMLMTTASMLSIMALVLTLSGLFWIEPSSSPERVYQAIVLALLWPILIFSFVTALMTLSK